MSDIFISYNKENRPIARMFAQELSRHGWSVFWDRNIPIGKTWRETIGAELQAARCVVVLWSKASLESGWVQEEADDAKRRGVLVPVLIEAVEPPIGFRSIQTANLVDFDPTHPTEASQGLIADIASLIGSPAKAAESGPPRVETAAGSTAAKGDERTPQQQSSAPAGSKASGPDSSLLEMREAPPAGRERFRMIAAAVMVLVAIAIAAVWQFGKNPPAAPPAAQDSSQATQQQAPRQTGVSLTELSLRMANQPLVTSAIIRAAKVLAAADKVMEFFEEGCDKDAKVRDFYRGMILAHAGYFLVIADLRTGSYRNYGFLPEDYSSLDRDSLYPVWTMDRISNVWQSSNALAAFAPDDKRALATFLAELKSYRATYALVKRAMPKLDNMDWRHGSPVERPAINEILKKAGRPPIGKCYQSDYGYKLKWNVTTNGETSIDFEPVDYMFGFWHRRDAEGKADLADWFLSAMVGWLKS